MNPLRLPVAGQRSVNPPRINEGYCTRKPHSQALFESDAIGAMSGSRRHSRDSKQLPKASHQVSSLQFGRRNSLVNHVVLPTQNEHNEREANASVVSEKSPSQPLTSGQLGVSSTTAVGRSGGLAKETQ
jgi:hypothetical protein